MKNIVLTWFMGTGKTAVAKELSRLLNMKSVDVDAEIEAAQGMTINDIFRNFGESRFREIETEMIKKIAAKENIIISTGGGAVLKEENMHALRSSGVIFCLSATPANILERVRGNDDRPLLKVDDPLAKITELLEFRRPFYDKAGEMIDTENKSPLRIAEEITEIFKCRK
jgi:shikimate kinase